MAGRKTKLTQERHDKIVRLIGAGNYAVIASKASGIAEDTYYEWLNRGKTDLEKGKKSVFSRFSEAIREAEAKAEADMVVLVKTAAVNGNFQAAAWYLERKQADRWGRSDKLKQEITGAGGTPLNLGDARESVLEFLKSKGLDDAEVPAD